MKRPSTSSCTRRGSASERSILLIATIGLRPSASAFRVTKRVCGIGPSAASTSSTKPSTMRRMRSTSPPKSACPGVSTMLILVPCQFTDVFFARIVMPRSFSSGLESITRSSTCWLARKAPACRSIWSTSVVLPWSTCAMIAMLRITVCRFPCEFTDVVARTGPERRIYRLRRSAPQESAGARRKSVSHSEFRTSANGGAHGCALPPHRPFPGPGVPRRRARTGPGTRPGW